MNNKAIELDDTYIMHTYGRYPVAIDHGKGARLYDTDGKEYIDFASGIGTLSLGTADEGWISAVTNQLVKASHLSNYFYSEKTSLLAEKLCHLSGMKKVFFASTGAEANEGAIKLARKYSFDQYGKGRSTILSLYNSFHGRTITTLSATGQDKFHDFFFPFTEGFRFSPLNDKDAFLSSLTKDVCAVICEPIQGEGGINIMTDEFALLLRQKCDENDILLIIDEVQTGVARTGKLFAHQYFGFKPDIMTLAKGLGGGLPIGAFLCGEKCKDTLGKGQHGTTFGGNPVVCSGALEVLNRVANEEFLNSVIEKGKYIKEKIASIKSEKIKEIRGKGLMIGIATEYDPKEKSLEALNQGLIVLTAGEDVIRLLPPLTITYDEIDEGLKILCKIL